MSLCCQKQLPKTQHPMLIATAHWVTLLRRLNFYPNFHPFSHLQGWICPHDLGILTATIGMILTTKQITTLVHVGLLPVAATDKFQLGTLPTKPYLYLYPSISLTFRCIMLRVALRVDWRPLKLWTIPSQDELPSQDGFAMSMTESLYKELV